MRGRKRVDWAGKRQGKLIVLSEAGRDAHGNVLWNCLCDCGTKCTKSNNNLAGGVKSCSTACGVTTSNIERSKHGMWKTKEYRAWSGMKQRCLNPQNKHYASYGGRGITVYPAWVNSFEAFVMDVGLAPQDALSLDRIDNDGNYEPSNVRWTTRKAQSNNRRVTLSAEIDGEVLPLSDIALKYGVGYMVVFQRFKRGLRGRDLITKQKIGRKPNPKEPSC